MKYVKVAISTLSSEQYALLAAMGELFDIRLVDPEHSAAHLDGYIVTCDRDASRFDFARGEGSYYIVLRGASDVRKAARTIRFADSCELPGCLRGRNVLCSDATSLIPLPCPIPNAAPVALLNGQPIWACRTLPRGRHHFVGSEIPRLAEEESLHQLFAGDRFPALLPLLTFFRQVAETSSWEPPPLQACLMFDDPNLHWPTYGYIDFARVLEDAQRRNYHACFATIPMDAWFTHPRVARMFREHLDRMSLLMHGNDHTSEELAACASHKARARLLQQALHRIRHLESDSGLTVSRIMAPPHGACSEQMLADMAEAGYEAASISSGSLKHFNRNAGWARTVGMQPCDMICDLPVLPRFRLSTDCRNSILVAAVLNQPIIAVGHHYDLANGLDVLTNTADFINSLGEVRWGSMAQIARTHYARMRESSGLHIAMYTRRADLIVPQEIEWVTVRWPKLARPAMKIVRLDGSTFVASNVDAKIPVRPGQRLVAEAVFEPTGDMTYPFAVIRPWSLVRRLLTESRDRIAPLLRPNRIATGHTPNRSGSPVHQQPAGPESAAQSSAIKQAPAARDIEASYPQIRACMVAYTFYESDGRVMRYAEALVSAGAEVDAIVLRRPGQAHQETINGVRVRRVWTRERNESSRMSYLFRICGFLLSSTVALAHLHLRHRYALIHVHSVPDFEVFAAILPKLLGAKIVLDIHDIVPEFYAAKFKVPSSSAVFRLLVLTERLSAAFADHVIAANELWRLRLISRSVSAKKCSALINFPDLSVFDRRLRTRVADGRFVLVYPGTLNWHQGVDLAVKAVSIVAARIPTLELHLYGEGSSAQDIRKLIVDLGVSDRVFLKPPLSQRQIAGIMANADLGVVPKRNDPFGGEAFSTKILEFMALGVPLVVADTRIDRYYFNDTLVRFFKAGDAEDLARAIIDANADRQRTSSLAARAQQHVQQYAWSTRKDEYLETVRSLVTNAPQ